MEQGNRIKVAVVGAGIIGTSTALCLAESGHNLDITVILKDFSPNTSGDGSAGSWFPLVLGPGTSIDELKFLCRETFNHLLDQLKTSSTAAEDGIGLISGAVIYKTLRENQIYSLKEDIADIFLNFGKLSSKELELS